MKKNTRYTLFFIILLGFTFSNGYAQTWNITGNNNINPALHFLGTTNNNPVIFKANNLERMRINVGTYRGVDIGTPGLNNELRIYGRDSVGFTIPLHITGNVLGQTWGNTPSQTLGRLVRFNQGPTSFNGGINFFDLGIGEDTSFFITNHSMPPTTGNGFIRKKMIVISPQDYVGIHLDPDVKPTANLHSEGTVRLQNLPAGAPGFQKVVTIDDDGNLAWNDKSELGGTDWSLTGNAGTDPNVNFVGTTDASPVAFRSDNLERMRINTGIYRGVDVGTPTLNNELRIFGRDSVNYTMPLTISGNIMDQTWGNNPSQTLGRLVRFNQGPSSLNGGINFFDLGIGEDTSFFITNHSVPPSVGNGFIRKKMIVISTEDNVGIHLDPTVKPTANLHSDGTVRFQNLPSGQGSVLVIDADGNVFKASSDSGRAAAPADITALQTEIMDLKAQLASLKEVVNNLKGGFLDLSMITGNSALSQNTPNPFNQATRISYYVPGTTRNASIRIADLSGRQIKNYTVSSGSEQSLTLQAGELMPGTYTYSLVIDGKIIDTKKLVLIR